MIEYTLTKPLRLANGDMLDKLRMDFDALSLADIANAKMVKGLLAQVKSASTADAVQSMFAQKMSPKMDPDFRIGVAWIAAMKGNDQLSINDCLQLSMIDAIEIGDLCLDSYFLR